MKTSFIVKLFIVFLGYFATARLGLSMPYVGSHVTLIWLPTGIAVAAMLRWGTGMTPAVMLGAFCVNMTISPNAQLSFFISIGNTLAPFVAASILSRIDFNIELKRKQDIFALIAIAFSSMLISSLLGSLSLMVSGILNFDTFAQAWLSWWLGDSIGVLLAAPVLLVMSKNSLSDMLSKKVEMSLWLTITAISSYFIFVLYSNQDGNLLVFAYLMIPLFIWASLRFDQFSASLGIVVMAIISTYGTSIGHGAFMLPSHHIGLMMLWSFLTTIIIINLLISALLSETRLAKEELYGLNVQLELRIEDETSKRLQKEKLLLQQSKMAMMGEMIGAIAHQWRQPLNSLGILVQDAHLTYKLGDMEDAYMDEFKANSMSIIQKMSRTIDDFRNFFRPNKEKEEFILEKAVDETLNIMRSQLLMHEIALNFDSASSHRVFGYKSELEQAILIMISNAKDALLDNGVKEPAIDINIEKTSDGKTILSIQDNAGGVPAGIMDRIFEPYFTTKEQGKGTGIGLYMAREIVERQMGGKIYVENINGGARFVVELNME